MRARRFATVAIVLGVMAILLASSAGLGCSYIKRIQGDIIAGQTEDAGDFRVTVYTNRIVIEFWIAGGWCLDDNHILVTTDMSDFVNKKWNPKIGKFPFEAEWVGSNKYMLTLWKADYPQFWGQGDVWIAIHVVVSDCCGGTSETGWAEGDMEWGSSWGWYFDP